MRGCEVTRGVGCECVYARVGLLRCAFYCTYWMQCVIPGVIYHMRCAWEGRDRGVRRVFVCVFVVCVCCVC